MTKVEKKVVALRLAGKKFEEIRLVVGLSRARVFQLWKKQLKHVSVQQAWERAVKKRKAVKVLPRVVKDRRVLHRCVGCRGEFGARQMRTHACVLKTWPMRYGKKYYEKWKRQLKQNQVARKKRAA